MPHFRFLLLALAALLGSCAAPGSSTPDKPAPVRPVIIGSSPGAGVWQLGEYEVRFAAGPRKHLPEGGRKSYSTFTVTCRQPGQPEISKAATSAIDVEILAEEPGTDITQMVKMFVSPSGRHLLISEDVPNEAAPCANFLLFELVGGALQFSRLDLPRLFAPPQPPDYEPAVIGDPPVIRGLTDDGVEFYYPHQQAPQRLRLQDIPRAARETYPG